MLTRNRPLLKIIHPQLRSNRIVAILALTAVVASVGFWLWNEQTRMHRLRVGSGAEMKYRKDLLPILCDEALEYDLKLEVQPTYNRAADSIAQVAHRQLDLAVVPAGLAIADENVRQVAVLDCEPLQLFVRQSLLAQGVAGLKGKRLNLGSLGSGSRIIAAEVLEFIGLKPEQDYQDAGLTYPELKALAPAQLPDAIFTLSPLPSALGEHLAQQCGYRLMELPFGAAMNLRRPAIEDVVIPAHTYAAEPAVPEWPLHTVGTRAVVIAHAAVPKIAIQHLLEVFYESDFARRAGIPPLNDALTLRWAEYPNHAGTLAYLHRHDPWINKDFIDNVSNLRGVAVSIISALLLAWQWLRRRKSSDLNDYLWTCTKLEIDASRAALRGEFSAERLADGQRQLAELRMDALEKHLAGVFPGDQQFGFLLARLESLQKSLPGLLQGQRASLPLAPLDRKAA